jgi:hypothetical protein
MSIENFIEEALYKPNDYIGYHVGRELAELHPDKLLVSSMVQWLSDEGKVSMDDVVVAQSELLRSQMNTKKEKKKQND